MILLGDCREKLARLEPESVDACVTDPPYELGFMGKAWDRTGVAYDPATWRAVLRVLKPGAHLLAFGGTRTYHRMACAIEDAGFEIRDQLQWLYGSGFPKSLDVSKAIDKAAGVEREVVGVREYAGGHIQKSSADKLRPPIGTFVRTQDDRLSTSPATDAARQWEGWGTALKPACEPICLARKPLVGTVAENVQAHGTGALNIDGCRIATEPGANLGGGRISSRADGWDRPWKADPDAVAAAHQRGAEAIAKAEALGRWPANVLLDGEAARLLDEQSGERPTSAAGPIRAVASIGYGGSKAPFETRGHGDSGGASRFFYVAKPNRRERDHGLDHLPLSARPTMGDGVGGQPDQARPNNRNTHPTVKPVDLLRYLIRLVTPPGGVVLDPFAGSGTTCLAAQEEGFRWIACEMQDEYVQIIRARTAQSTLFGGSAA